MKRSNSKDLLLSFLEEIEVNGALAPSVREICHKLGLRSTNAAQKLILQLHKEGIVIYQPGLARSLRLVEKPKPGIPLLGSIAAGFPDSTDTAEAEYIPLNPASFGIKDPSQAFALRVRGDSMTGKRFFDGDLVLLDRKATPKHQDVVVALIDQECTLKTLIHKNGKTWLKAENPAYPDLIPAHDLEIQGVAKAVIRILVA